MILPEQPYKIVCWSCKEDKLDHKPCACGCSLSGLQVQVRHRSEPGRRAYLWALAHALVGVFYEDETILCYKKEKGKPLDNPVISHPQD